MKVFAVLVLLIAGLISALPSDASAQGSGGDMAVARQALAAARKDHFDEAARLVRQSRVKVLPLLVTWMAYVSGRSDADFAHLTAFIDANPDWPMMTQMVKRAEESITAATPSTQVLGWFDHHAPTTADGGMAYARALFTTGRSEQAVKVVREWAGQYDYNTLDQNAIVGPHPDVTNFLFLNGFSGHGLQQSPAMGRGTAEWLTYGEFRSLDLTPFSFERIAANRPLIEGAII